MSTKQFLGGRIILGTEFSGYKFYFFEPGTSTPKTTYKDSSLTVGNENADPVVLDANGAAQIWFSGNADVTLKTSTGTTVYTDSDINLTATSSTTGTGNLALNPSFEDDTDADGIPDNWTRTLYTGGAFVIDTTDSYNGAQCIKFTSTGTGGGYITSTATFAVSPSVIYSIGWAMKGTIDVRNTVDILWYKLDGSASATSSTNVYDNSASNPTTWTEKWYEVTSPSDAAFASIRLTGCHSSDATAGNTRFDQVVFTDLAHKRSPNTLFRALAQAKGANVATAAVCDIWSPADGDTVHLTGTATLTSFGTATQAGCKKDCLVDGTFIMVSGTNLVIPVGTLTAVANDKFKVYADSVSKMYVIDYTRANGQPLMGYPSTNGCSLVYVDHQTAGTTTAIVFTTQIGTTYDVYEFELVNVTPITDDQPLLIQFSTDTGTTWGTSNYYFANSGYRSDASSVGAVNAAGPTNVIRLSGANGTLAISSNSGSGWNGIVNLYKPTDTTIGKKVSYYGGYIGQSGTNNPIVTVNGYGHNSGTAAVSGVKFLFNSGNIATGEFYLRGKKKS